MPTAKAYRSDKTTRGSCGGGSGGRSSGDKIRSSKFSRNGALVAPAVQREWAVPGGRVRPTDVHEAGAVWRMELVNLTAYKRIYKCNL